MANDAEGYAVRRVPGYSSYYVGRDQEGRACVLIEDVKTEKPGLVPIRLTSVDVQFSIRCRISVPDEAKKEGCFTVVRCRSTEAGTIRYFLSVCEVIMRMLGNGPREQDVAEAVYKLASILQKTRRPPVRTVSGLFGELYVIARSNNPTASAAAWRTRNTSRFDFVVGEVRMDVKTASGRVRAHVMSYEQCNGPADSFAVVASMFLERVAQGTSLESLVTNVAERLASNPDLVLKLYDVIADTLGRHVQEGMRECFDASLADSSLRFFNLAEVPAIRTPLPGGVSDVHFRADFSSTDPLDIEVLARGGGPVADLLPRAT